LGKKEYKVEVQPQIEQEFLTMFYSENPIPNEILLNKRVWSNTQEKAAIEGFLSTKRGAKVKLTIPSRGVKKELVELAKKNIEASLAEDNVLAELQAALDLPVLPRIIECFDVSNLGQEHVVAGMVRFADGKPDKSNYRRFKIKNVSGQDDFAAMQEAVTRRYKRLQNEKQSMPDLVMVDGGAGQVAAAKEALNELGLELPLIGLAKEHEEIYLPNEKAPKKFEPNSRMMLLLRQIRDATHNFAVRYNRKRRQMKMRTEFSN
jgi:excinuclease ABC subunit C